ncbi:unnamed protein product, partial [Rotaria sp. Silwood1]
IVIAVHGYEDDKGIFIVKDYCFKDLLIPKQLSSLKEDKFFLFASGFLLSETSIIFNQLEYLFLFHNLISYTITDIDIMPGVNDPCCHMLPQQPLHPCIFPSSSKRKTTHCLTNPYDFQIVFLQTSGQNLDDIYPLSTIDDRVQILENCLELCAIAPICPDTLSPHDIQVRLICIPSFAQSNSYIVLNLRTLECCEISFQNKIPQIIQ